MNQKSISVIIPAYNVADFVGECIESVISQNINDLEIIIINDGSTDNTLEICNKYASKDNRIRIIDQSNKGVSAARNNGLKNCNGDWVMFVDADDWLEKDALTSVIPLLDSSKTDLVAFALKEGNFVEDKNYDVKEFSVNEYRRELLGYCIISTHDWPSLFPAELLSDMNLNGPVAKLFRRKILIDNDILFDETMKIAEDQDFNLQYIACINSIKYYNRPYYNVRIRNTSASRSISGVLDNHQTANKKLSERIEALSMSDGLNIYWKAHLIEDLLIITRIIADNKYQFTEFWGKIRELKGFIKQNQYRQAIKRFPKHLINSKKKKVMIMLYNYNLVYFVNLLYRYFR